MLRTMSRTYIYVFEALCGLKELYPFWLRHVRTDRARNRTSFLSKDRRKVFPTFCFF